MSRDCLKELFGRNKTLEKVQMALTKKGNRRMSKKKETLDKDDKVCIDGRGERSMFNKLNKYGLCCRKT